MYPIFVVVLVCNKNSLNKKENTWSTCTCADNISFTIYWFLQKFLILILNWILCNYCSKTLNSSQIPQISQQKFDIIHDYFSVSKIYFFTIFSNYFLFFLIFLCSLWVQHTTRVFELPSNYPDVTNLALFYQNKHHLI